MNHSFGIGWKTVSFQQIKKNSGKYDKGDFMSSNEFWVV